MVKLLAVQEPPSSLPYITSYITDKQLPDTKGSIIYLLIRVISSINSINYNLGEEDTLGLQLKLSPILPSINSPHKIHTSLNFNRENNQELPAEAKDNKEDKGEVKELLLPKSCKAKIVFKGGSLPKSFSRVTRKTPKAASQLKPHRASRIKN